MAHLLIRLGVVLLILYFVPGLQASAGTFIFNSQTTFRAFQRDTSQGEDKAVLPIYQYLQLGFGDSEQGGVSLHLYGWGRKDLAESTYFEDSTDGELLYGYLEYSRPYSAFRLNLGRQHIFAGVTNQSMDGLQVTAGLGELLTATLFGGITAGSDVSGSDTTYGGRVAFHPQPHYEFGLSHHKTELEGDPDHRAGMDFSFNWSDWLTILGLSSFNLDTSDWREHSYSAALHYKDAVLEPSYHMFSYQDYFATGTEENNLFHFLKNSAEQITILGANLQWQGATPMGFTGRYNHYTYDVRQEEADYYSALVSLALSGNSEIGAEVGRMAGQSEDNIYSLSRAYFYWSNPFNLSESAYCSGDGIYQVYDVAVFGEDRSLNFSLSAGLRFLNDSFELTLTGLYSTDPYFVDNVEGLLTLRYTY